VRPLGGLPTGQYNRQGTIAVPLSQGTGGFPYIRTRRGGTRADRVPPPTPKRLYRWHLGGGIEVPGQECAGSNQPAQDAVQLRA